MFLVLNKILGGKKRQNEERKQNCCLSRLQNKSINLNISLLEEFLTVYNQNFNTDVAAY